MIVYIGRCEREKEIRGLVGREIGTMGITGKLAKYYIIVLMDSIG